MGDFRNRLYGITEGFERALVPGNLHAQDSYLKLLQDLVRPGMRWLDLGCGHQLLPFWRRDQEAPLISRCALACGLDYDLPSLKANKSHSTRCRGDVSSLPFADASFDLVTANMVVEHLRHPQEQFREVARVLKPGGIFAFHTPNALGYPTLVSRVLPYAIKRGLAVVLDGRATEDVFPTFYRANSPASITQLTTQTGFVVRSIDLVTSSAVFSVVPPVAALELCAIRLLRSETLREFRTNLVVALERVA